jgi:hypothetical protein
MTPVTGDPAPQTDTKAGNEPTTETPAVPESFSDDADVMKRLGIPADVQAQIAPKPEPEETEPAEDEGEPPEPEPEPVAAEADEEEESEEEVQPEVRLDKRDKRIGKLTRQKKEAQERADKLEAELEKVRAEGEKRASDQKAKEDVVPASKEQSDLEGKLSLAKSTVAWCKENSDGGTLEHDGKEVYLDADEVSRFQEFYQDEVLRITPELVIAKREARQHFQAERSNADSQAKRNWPDMFDRSKEDYQIAQNLVREFPPIANYPYANYVVGLVIEGIKSLKAREPQSNGSKKHRDISERAFEPRVPIAPHSANPPSRDVRPSPTKKYDQAMSTLVKEGGRDNLVAALAAMDETQPQTGPKGRRLVQT